MNKKILFVCTSNRDRSPALEKYFSELYPQHEYRSAGINNYFCEKHGTHCLNLDDLVWADMVVFAETIHKGVVMERYHKEIDSNIDCFGKPKDFGMGMSTDSMGFKDYFHADYQVLNAGEYEQGNVGEDYLTRAEQILKYYLTL